jgi:hypothetical protein
MAASTLDETREAQARAADQARAAAADQAGRDELIAHAPAAAPPPKLNGHGHE